jgi:hypothetical protein
MPRFTNFTAAPYTGNISGQAVGICRPSKYDATVVPIVIDWADYPGGGVSINIQSQQVLTPIDFIRSLVIDNLGQRSDVEVYFPDTGFTVACAGNHILSAFAFTYQLTALIFNTTSNPVGSTTVYFCNFLVDTYDQTPIQSTETLFAASSPANGTQYYAAPALGTFRSYLNVPMSPRLTPFNIMASPRASGKFVLTQIECTLIGVYSPTAQAQVFAVQIIDNFSNIQARWQGYVMNDLGNGYLKVENAQTQVTLDATRAYFLENAGASLPGSFEFYFSWDWISA